MPSLFIEDPSKPGRAFVLSPRSFTDAADAPTAKGEVLVGIFCDKDTPLNERVVMLATSIVILNQTNPDWITVLVTFGVDQQINFNLSTEDSSEATLFLNIRQLHLSYK